MGRYTTLTSTAKKIGVASTYMDDHKLTQMMLKTNDIGVLWSVVGGTKYIDIDTMYINYTAVC